MKLIDTLREAESAFGDAAFADRKQKDLNDDPTYSNFLGMQGRSDADAEPNTSKEDKIYKALLKWVGDANDSSAKDLSKNIDALKKGKQLFPAIFAPEKPDGTKVYRGIKKLSQPMYKSLAASTKKEDWVQIKDLVDYAGDEDGWFICKKPINYTPRREWQSWSYDADSAIQFAGQGILVTKQDSDFYFSSKTMELIYANESENEILHHGQTYSNPVYLTVNKTTLYKMWKGDLDDEPKKGKKVAFNKMTTQLMGK